MRLKTLLRTAYDVELYQIIGPAWLDAEHYMVIAKVPEGATREQVNLMWQSLLKDRFGVMVHHESREFQGEEITLPKGASKLKETDLPDSTPEMMRGAGPNDLIVMGDGDARRLVARAQSLAQVAAFLAQVAGHPVLDKTGLAGRYDFSVEFDINQPCVSCSIAIALEQELGLKLVKNTVQLDVIVVDHAEKVPTGN
ncbi:MAG TPA: TIGR03435 family protein [Bryobacteraceae bacterium]